MAYKQETDSPLGHCWSNVMHLQPWNKMRSRTAAAAGRGLGNKPSLKAAEKRRESPLGCWKDYERVPGTVKGAKGSCRPKKGSPATKQKGGGTRKVCLPKSKVENMSAEEKAKVVAAKESAAAKGKYKRSSKSNVKGARKKGATLRDWFENENWINVKTGEPCGK